MAIEGKSVKDREFDKFANNSANETSVRTLTEIDTTNSGAIPVTVNPAAAPTITNLSAPTANVEVSHTLQANVNKILVRCRGNGSIKFAFVSGESATKYITIPKGASYKEDGLLITSGTLYLQTDQNSQTIEILEWV